MNQIFLTFLLFCGLYYTTGQTFQSECQKARVKAQASTSPINLVPNCEPNGNYSALQCHSNSTWCQCWTADGSPVSQPSKKTKRCECILERHNVQSLRGPQNIPLVGAFEPKCAPNGGYRRHQCHGSTGHCWCVSDVGVQIGDKVRGALNCTHIESHVSI